jgi:hypothetical protein
MGDQVARTLGAVGICLRILSPVKALEKTPKKGVMPPSPCKISQNSSLKTKKLDLFLHFFQSE